MLKVVLTKHQWQRFSELLGNLGLLTLASVVIPYLLNEFNLVIALFGLVISFLAWYASIVLAKKY